VQTFDEFLRSLESNPQNSVRAGSGKKIARLNLFFAFYI